MAEKPEPLGLIASSITSPSKTPASATETPSGLGQYGVVSRPRFLTNQVTSPASVKANSPNPNRNSFRYRPSRPSLGYIFDRPPSGPPAPAGGKKGSKSSTPTTPNGSSKKKDKKDGKKGKTKGKAKAKGKTGGKKVSKQQQQEIDKINSIRQQRKQSTLASFSSTPNNQTMDAIKRELEFLKKEVPSFGPKYQTALAAFHSTSHSKSRQVEYAFIQALSSWIVEDGAPAVRQLDEFKEDVQHEITGLVSTCEELSKQNQQLTILISDLRQQNEEVSKAYSDTSKELSKLNTVVADAEVEQETEQLKENDFVDLSQDLERSQEQNKILKEKIRRLESYLKQTQKDNDDLSNKTYSMENELQQSKAETARLHGKVATLEQQHEQELMILAQAHEDYKTQMESEQAQLIEIAEESQKQIQQMAANVGKPRSGTVVTPMFDDTDYNANAPLTEDAGTTLEAEFTQYPFSEDEWLDDSEEQVQSPPTDTTSVSAPAPPRPQLSAELLDSNSINISPVRPDSPPPFDAEFETEKQMYGASPIDPTKTFVMEKEKRGVELEDPSKHYASERKAYGVETEDVTQSFETETQKVGQDQKDVTEEFAMEKQDNSIVTEEKDASQEFESVKERAEVEQKDPTQMWRNETSGVMEVVPIDPEASFVSEKKEFGVDPEDPTKTFETQTKKQVLERADLSNTFVMESKKEIREEPREEPVEFVMEKKKNTHHGRDASLELQFSQTDLSYTPKVSDAEPPKNDPPEFESGRMSIVQDKEPPRPQYAYQIRHLRMDVDAAPPRVTRIRKPPPAAHERPDYNKYYDGKDEIIRKSLAFQKIMSKWKKDEIEKGGKPEILRQKEYEMINKWNQDEKSKLLQTKKPVNASSDGSPASPNYEIFSHLTGGNMQQKVLKARNHKLRPKLQGGVKVIRSHFVPKYQLRKEAQMWFCLDGLPSLTNLDKNEAEKNRKNDFLVPVLFFFDSEQDLKQLEREAGALAVRNAMFQKAFARHAKGIITLHTHACDTTLDKAQQRLEQMKGRKVEVKNRDKDVKEQTGKSLYILNERDFHRLEFDTAEMRDEWMHKMNKLVAKRTNSVQKATETFQGSHKQSLGIGTPVQRAARASSRMSTVEDVEHNFD